LLKDALKALGKSVLIVTGVGYGIVKALDAFAGDAGERVPQGEGSPRQASPDATDPDNRIETAMLRLDSMEERLIRIESGLESLLKPVEPAVPAGREAFFVTHDELTAAMAQISRSIEGDVERRFQVQNRSVQSLRTMIAHTDALLEHVLESIDSAEIHA
jgi:hypothetical protein